MTMAANEKIQSAISNLRVSAEKQGTIEKLTLGRAVVKIKVFGVGGGGGSVLKRLAEGDLQNIDFVAVNTDARALSALSDAPIKVVQIGGNLTKSHGTGGNVELGEQAARSDAETLKDLMKGADMIFITAAMGGGAGTGAAPIIAEIAKQLGILTVGVVTFPFTFEGVRKQRIANAGIIKMQANMDALVVVKNDNLMKLPENRTLSVIDAFRAADSILRQAIRCIAELILTTGFINVDFADVKTIFQQSNSSDAILGIGRSNIGAVQAVQQALESPLFDRSLKGARGIILNVTGDETLTLYEVDEAAKYILTQTEFQDKDEVNIIFGTVINKKMNGIVQATLIATDFADSLAIKAPTISVPKSNLNVQDNFNFAAPNFSPPNADKPKNIIPIFDMNRKDK